MQLSQNLDKATLAKLKALYLRAFPRSERKPFGLMQKNPLVDILAITEDGNFCGLFIVARGKCAYLLDYFAVSEDYRGKGIGSSALELLSEHYDGKRIVIEIEDPSVPSDNADQRARRKAFYLRNGFDVSADKVNLFGEQMLLLSLNGEITFEEYKSVFTDVYGHLLSVNVKKL